MADAAAGKPAGHLQTQSAEPAGNLISPGFGGKRFGERRHPQHDLANVLARLHAPERGLRFRQRERFEAQRLQLAGCKCRRQPTQKPGLSSEIVAGVEKSDGLALGRAKVVAPPQS